MNPEKWVETLQDSVQELKRACEQANDRLKSLSQEMSWTEPIEALLAQRVAQLSLIHHVSSRVAAELELDKVLELAVRLTQESFDYHHVALFLVDGEVARLKAIAGSYTSYFPPGHSQRLSEGIIGWVIRHGQKVAANDVNAEPRYISLIANYTITQAELCLPIKVAGQTVGALDIQSPRLHIFNENDIVAMETLTHQVATAIQNAWLYERAQRELAERQQAQAALQQVHAELEQKVAERTVELQRSEKRYRDLVDNAYDLVQSLEADGRLGYVNRRWLSALGYSAGEVPNLYFEQIVSPDQRRLWQRIFRQLQAGQQFVNQRLVLVDKAGRKLVVEANLIPYFESDQFSACQGILRDITEHERAEEALTTRLLYEQALSACYRLLFVTNLGQNEALNKTLSELQLATDTSRVCLFKNGPDATTGLGMRLTHEACGPGVAAEMDNPAWQRRPYKEGFERWQTTLARGEPIVGLVASLPPAERTILEAEHVLSILLLPIWVEEQWYGFIGFNDMRQPRVWDESDIQLLQTAAGLIGAYLERRRVEQVLRESEEKYRILIEQSDSAIFLLYGGKFEVVNRRFEELFGVTHEMANSPGFVFSNLVALKSRAQMLSLVSRRAEPLPAGQPGRPPRYEFTALDRNGHEIEVEMIMSYPTYRGGLATQGIIQDITERKRNEEERQRAYQQAQQYAAELTNRVKEERRQREIATILAEVVASISLTLSTDELLEHILLKLQQLVAYDSASIFLVEGPTLEPTLSVGTQAPTLSVGTQARRAARGLEVEVSHQHYPVAGNTLFQAMLASKSYILIPDTRDAPRLQALPPGLEKMRCWVGAPLLVAQEIIGLLSVNHCSPGAFSQAEASLVQAFAHQVAQTIHNARLFADLKAAQSQLVERERLAALGQMAAMVAHELRNPLMTLRTGLEDLLSEVAENDPRQQGAERLQATIDRIDRIVEDILSVARAPQVSLAPSSLQAVIEAEAAQWERYLAERKITCSLQLAPYLPPVRLDPNQVSRALANLIVNSVDALPNGGVITISLALSGQTQVITFADNGAGIPSEDLSRIFEPFFTTKTRGTGLGLYLVRQIIEHHGGTMSVWSEVGQGTRFTISLPAGIEGL